MVKANETVRRKLKERSKLTKATKDQVEEALAKLAKQLHPSLKGTSVSFVYELRDDECIWDVYKVGRRIKITYHGSMHDLDLKDQLARACRVATNMLSGQTTAVRVRGRRTYDL